MRFKVSNCETMKRRRGLAQDDDYKQNDVIPSNDEDYLKAKKQ